MARKRAEETFVCNNCGEEVRMSAKACPYCGADDETAWKEGAMSQSLYDPDDDTYSSNSDFDYDDFVRREIHGKTGLRLPTWIWVVATLMILVFLFGVIRTIYLW